MQISFKLSAEKELKKFPKSEQKKVLRKIKLLSESPLAGKLLKGELVGLRSLRAWPYKIYYFFNKSELLIVSVSC